VWAVGVVVREILLQHDIEVAWSGDQKVIEAFPAQCADEAFRNRVRPGRLDGGADDPDVGTGEDRVERGGDLAVPVADQEPNRSARSPRSINRLRACWMTLWGSRSRLRALTCDFRRRVRTR
jgi:hypothetical protein